MFGGSRKPYSAVTVQIDRLTSEQYEEEDFGGLIDLVEVIRIQASGPTEAARALRKKLKYGTTHRQIRALVILDGLMENGDSRFQRAFLDEPLLERLRIMAREDMVDPSVKKKCQVLFIQWANAYKNTPGLERIANLYKELPRSQRPMAARQKVVQDDHAESESEARHSPSPAATPSGSRSRATSSAQPPLVASAKNQPVTLTPASSALPSKHSKSKSKYSYGKPFNLAKEKDNMTNCIARASIASTNLLNGLQLANRETERVSQNPEIVSRFETAKSLRRQILLYIQQVESDDWIGSLVNANDELVKALTAYEIMDRSIEDDSDSEWEQPPPEAQARPTQGSHSRHVSADTAAQLAGLSLAEGTPPSKPARPAPASVPMPPPPSFPDRSSGHSDAGEEDDEDDDPFGDSNAAPTPHQERPVDPSTLDLQCALARSGSQLKFEDRIVSWQRDTAYDGHGSASACSIPNSDRHPRHSGGSPVLFTLSHALRSPDSLGRESKSRPLTARNLALGHGNTSAEPEQTRTSRRGSSGLFKRLGKILNNYVTQPSKRIPLERLPTREATNAASLRDLRDVEVGQSASTAVNSSRAREMPIAGGSPTAQEGRAPQSSQSSQDSSPRHSTSFDGAPPAREPLIDTNTSSQSNIGAPQLELSDLGDFTIRFSLEAQDGHELN
ncbi:hypothetical protein NU219Hw_g7389t1 [Hortaea werneckii]